MSGFSVAPYSLLEDVLVRLLVPSQGLVRRLQLIHEILLRTEKTTSQFIEGCDKGAMIRDQSHGKDLEEHCCIILNQGRTIYSMLRERFLTHLQTYQLEKKWRIPSGPDLESSVV